MNGGSCRTLSRSVVAYDHLAEAPQSLRPENSGSLTSQRPLDPFGSSACRSLPLAQKAEEVGDKGAAQTAHIPSEFINSEGGLARRPTQLCVPVPGKGGRKTMAQKLAFGLSFSSYPFGWVGLYCPLFLLDLLQGRALRKAQPTHWEDSSKGSDGWTSAWLLGTPSGPPSCCGRSTALASSTPSRSATASVYFSKLPCVFLAHTRQL